MNEWLGLNGTFRKTVYTVSILHDAQLLLNKQQQICRGVYIHWLFSSSTDTVIVPHSRTNKLYRAFDEYVAVKNSEINEVDNVTCWEYIQWTITINNSSIWFL